MAKLISFPFDPVLGVPILFLAVSEEKPLGENVWRGFICASYAGDPADGRGHLIHLKDGTPVRMQVFVETLIDTSRGQVVEEISQADLDEIARKAEVMSVLAEGFIASRPWAYGIAGISNAIAEYTRERAMEGRP